MTAKPKTRCGTKSPFRGLELVGLKSGVKSDCRLEGLWVTIRPLGRELPAAASIRFHEKKSFGQKRCGAVLSGRRTKSPFEVLAHPPFGGFLQHQDSAGWAAYPTVHNLK